MLGTSGSGAYSDVAAGILWAADVSKGNAQVITMSLGGKANDPTVTRAIADIEDPNNVNYTHPVITVAAGNTLGERTAVPGFPRRRHAADDRRSPVCARSGTNTSRARPEPLAGGRAVSARELLVERAWSGTGTAHRHQCARHEDQLHPARTSPRLATAC